MFDLYDCLSAELVDSVTFDPKASWRDRFLVALEASLAVLGPHREELTLRMPAMIATGEDGLFSGVTSFARKRVEGIFIRAITEAHDAPDAKTAAAMGRLLYVMHLGVILWWLLDRSPSQRTTSELVATLRKGRPLAKLVPHLPYAKSLIAAADALCREGLYGEESWEAPRSRAT